MYYISTYVIYMAAAESANVAEAVSAVASAVLMLPEYNYMTAQVGRAAVMFGFGEGSANCKNTPQGQNKCRFSVKTAAVGNNSDELFTFTAHLSFGTPSLPACFTMVRRRASKCVRQSRVLTPLCFIYDSCSILVAWRGYWVVKTDGSKKKTRNRPAKQNAQCH